jgi:Uma2 family endonuclease
MNAFAATATVPRKVKLTVDDFLALDARGAFEGYAKSELIEGDVYGMNAQHGRHARIKSRLFAAMVEALRCCPELEAIVEAAVPIPPHDVPEPDLLIVVRPVGDGLIPVESVRLVVEVADTTLSTDLGIKAALYARGGVPEYWVVDVNGRRLHQFTEPDAAGYRKRLQTSWSGLVPAATIPDLVVDLPEDWGG